MELMPEELVEEILLRVPPDEPAYLVRVALVCRPWRRILSDRGFLRPRPTDRIPRFVRTSTTSPFSPPALGCDLWWALDCRHSRVLIHTVNHDHLVVWYPLTGDQQHLSIPASPGAHMHNGAVLCAKHVDGGCDHLDCGHGGSFVVVIVDVDTDHVVRASAYSSETRAWGATTSVHVDDLFEDRTSLLADAALHFTLKGGRSILKYDLSGHRLSVIGTPGDFAGMFMMEAEDGGLGFVAVLDGCIYLWTQQHQEAGTTRWAQHRAIELGRMLPRLIGFAEGTNAVFINRYEGVFVLDLKSRKVRMVGERGNYRNILPYMSFYTPSDTPSVPNCRSFW
ncbi:hypothetical protein GQ55_9G609700 [Panicum hallii var. hallii]|uniref:F-box domain-containing protein n=1 Tax=Panicum hallii var. hallii TaxID=1504633 RepID=A0A2T7CHJ0_9POAL|nr:hypothetical protein GQ55_9G609700 [Panicum hallii var. hallii]